MTDQGFETLARSFEREGAGGARIALVLGSGLGSFSERLAERRVVPYGELEGMPPSTVKGHAGRFVLGQVAGVSVAVLEGRVHRYEGRSVEETTRAVRALASLGVRALVLTNAAGGLEPQWQPPLLMRIVDHVDLQATRFSFPISGLHAAPSCDSIASELQPKGASHRHATRNARGSKRTSKDAEPSDDEQSPNQRHNERRDQERRDNQNGSPYDPASPYDAELGRAIELAAREAGIPLFHGIYAGLLGPTYETPAEVRMLRWLGASAVGMSTVAEAAAAFAAGMRVAALSCITNPAAGIARGKLSHEEVVAAGARIAATFCALLEAAVPRIEAELGAG